MTVEPLFRWILCAGPPVLFYVGLKLALRHQRRHQAQLDAQRPAEEAARRARPYEPHVPTGGWCETLDGGWLTCSADGLHLGVHIPVGLHGASHVELCGGIQSAGVEQGALVLTYPEGVQVRHELGGPLAESAARCLRGRLALPRSVQVHDVSEEALRADPRAWNGRWVRVRAHLSAGFEYRDFAGLWFTRASEEGPCESGQLEVMGLVRCSEEGRGHGHLGVYAGELVAFSLKYLRED